MTASRTKSISDEDAKELRRISDVFTVERFSYSEDKYQSLSFCEIETLLKDKYPFSSTDILVHRKDIPLELLEFLYKKNKSTKFQWEFLDTPLERERLRIRRAEILGFIACHPNVSLKLMLSIADHPSPEARLIATENPLMPPVLKNEIYKEIVENQGYGDKVILLKTLAKRELSANLRNRVFQEMFDEKHFVTDEYKTRVFAEELLIKKKNITGSFTGDDYREYKIRDELERHRAEFIAALRTLAFVDKLNLKTVNKVIASEHNSSIAFLSTNPYLSAESYESLLAYGSSLDTYQGAYLVECLAANPSFPKEKLEELTDKVMPDLSYKSRGAKVNPIAMSLASNPSTPLESLLKLHSLHNVEEAERYMKSNGNYHYAGELNGTPLMLWNAVEENPTYKEWVAATPNYKDLLPPIIKCTCHNL